MELASRVAAGVPITRLSKRTYLCSGIAKKGDRTSVTNCQDIATAEIVPDAVEIATAEDVPDAVDIGTAEIAEILSSPNYHDRKKKINRRNARISW